MNFVIRRRRDPDNSQCLALAELVRRRDGYPPLGPIDIRHFLAPPYELAGWVAESNSKILGHAALHSTGFPVTIEKAVQCTGLPASSLGVVARMFVAPESRRAGIAKALLDTVVSEAHQRGLRPILDTATHFDAAIKLYESAGFECAGEVTFVWADEPRLSGRVLIGPASATPRTR